MEAIKSSAAKLWRRYRGLPMWGQIVLAVLVLSVVVGPFLDASEKSNGQADARPTTTERPATTTTTRRDTTTTAEPTTTEKTRSLDDRVNASNDGTLLVSKEDLGDEWPLTVPDGLLSCRRVPGINERAIVFGTDDTAYAINGIARAKDRAAEMGWRDLGEIWLDDPSLPGTKMDVGLLIALGQRLCR